MVSLLTRSELYSYVFVFIFNSCHSVLGCRSLLSSGEPKILAEQKSEQTTVILMWMTIHLNNITAHDSHKVVVIIGQQRVASLSHTIHTNLWTIMCIYVGQPHQLYYTCSRAMCRRSHTQKTRSVHNSNYIVFWRARLRVAVFGGASFVVSFVSVCASVLFSNRRRCAIIACDHYDYFINTQSDTNTQYHT